ncbi:MAG: arylsulfotransferase family protein [Alphaproteobacteria bacterium]
MRDIIIGGLTFYCIAICCSIVFPSVFAGVFLSPAEYYKYHEHKLKSSSSQVLTGLYLLDDGSYPKGITINRKEKVWGDYAFVVNDADNAPSLIDVDGKVVHKWDAEFFRKWGDITHIADPVSPQHIEGTRIFMDPEMNGDIYVGYYANSDAYLPYYGLLKLDKDSNVLWKHEDRTHHDAEFIGNDQMLVFVSYMVDGGHPNVPHIEEPMYHEYVVWLDTNTGEEIKRVDIAQAFANSKYSEVLHRLTARPTDTDLRPGDVFHPNGITKIPDHVIGKAPMLKENSVILSIRNLDMLAILDLEKDIITWASLGPWRGQHSLKFMDNGNVIMFDNFGSVIEGGPSRILEVDLETSEIVWEYTGTKDKPFFSKYSSMIDRLPNGNIFAVSTLEGRAFEVTRSKEIVWEYYVEARFDTAVGSRIPNLTGEKKYKKEQLLFLD